jgi:hypothetical protein
MLFRDLQLALHQQRAVWLNWSKNLLRLALVVYRSTAASIFLVYNNHGLLASDSYSVLRELMSAC